MPGKLAAVVVGLGAGIDGLMLAYKPRWARTKHQGGLLGGRDKFMGVLFIVTGG